MSDLTLIRHAKSDWDDPALSDFDRPLNRRGKQAAPLMGRRIAERRMIPELIISSPARRARSTAKRIGKAMGLEKSAILYKEELYGATLDQLIALLHALPDCRHIAILGHNPGLSDLGQWLCAEAPEWLPTCAALTLNLPFANWRHCERGCGRLVCYDYPKK